MSRFFKSFTYAWKGIRAGLAGERNMRIHVAIALAIVALAFYFKVTEGEWMAIAVAIGLVIAAELFNTAIEHLVDLISPERHAAAGKIKDLAAGAVLVSSVAALIVGIIIFMKYVF
jgi:diacylglycerol kinase (ATP)